MFESALFRHSRESAEAAISRLTAHPALGLLYMLVVLPLFLLTALVVVIGGLPGIVIHELLWKGAHLREARERTKVFHDISLVLFVSISVALVLAYVFPQFAGLLTDDPRCSTMPYC